MHLGCEGLRHAGLDIGHEWLGGTDGGGGVEGSSRLARGGHWIVERGVLPVIEIISGQWDGAVWEW